jgi:uracil-DNA glycosylase
VTALRKLLRDAYYCKRCPTKFGFVMSPNHSYFKFPPIIAGKTPAKLLFVGINPRRSSSNFALHRALMTSKQAFADLAANRINGSAYIHTTSDEPHYHDHLTIIRGVFGNDCQFDSCAAVTELFLCATENSSDLSYPHSDCADHFLPHVLAIVQPQAIVAVGSRVMNYFKTKSAKPSPADEFVSHLHGQDYPIVRMPHHGNTRLSPSQRRAQINTCIRKLRNRLGCS